MLRLARTLGAVVLVLVGIGTAHAQDGSRRGWETGLDVSSSPKSGEAAWYLGAFEGNQLMAVRFGARDETDAIPCSAGVMYEFVGKRGAASAIKPMAGASYSRIFSCATDQEYVERPSPPLQGTATVSVGFRVSVLKSKRVGGSLKVLAYVERARGHERAADMTSKGLVVGVAFHRR